LLHVVSDCYSVLCIVGTIIKALTGTSKLIYGQVVFKFKQVLTRMEVTQNMFWKNLALCHS